MAVAIFGYLFNEYSIQGVYNSLIFMNIPLFITVLVAYFLGMYILDTFIISKILNHFGHKTTLKELLPGRGVTYLIMVINYAAAQAAFALYEHRKHNVPMSKMFGIFGIIVVIDLMLLATLAFITTFFTSWPYDVFGIGIESFVRIFTVVGYSILVLNILFWRGHLGKINFFEKLRKKDFFSVLTQATFKDYAKVILLRLPVHAYIMCGIYIVFITYRTHVPFINVLSNMPIILFIGAIPITPGGLGSTNVAVVEFFKPFITSEAIRAGKISAGELLLSFSIMWTLGNYMLKAITGFICLKFVSKDLFKKASAIDTNTPPTDISHIADNL